MYKCYRSRYESVCAVEVRNKYVTRLELETDIDIPENVDPSDHAYTYML